MGPRKKAKPNPKAEVGEIPPAPEAVPLPETPGASKGLDEQKTQSLKPVDEPSKSSGAAGSGERTDTPASARSWYGGTWPRTPKAAPITKVARESITSAAKAISEAPEAAATRRPRTPLGQSTPLRAPSLYLSSKLGNSTRSLPISATTTKINVSSSSLSKAAEVDRPKSLDENGVDATSVVTKAGQEKVANKAVNSIEPDHEELPHNETLETGSVKAQEGLAGTSGNQPGWLSWLSRSEQASGSSLQASFNNQIPGQSLVQAPRSETVEQSSVQASNVHSDTLAARKNHEPSNLEEAKDGEHRGDTLNSDVPTLDVTAPRSWLAIWTSPVASTRSSKEPMSTTTITETPTKTPNKSAEATVLNHVESHKTGEANGSPGWTFWSRGTSTAAASDSTSMPISGKLAVADPKSQSQSLVAVVEGNKGAASLSAKSLKRERPQSVEVGEDTTMSSKTTSNAAGNSAIGIQLPVKIDSKKNSPALLISPGNLILPALHENHNVASNPGFLNQLRNLLYVAKAPPPKHVNLLEKPVPIKTALAIGVHGYFPAPLIRTVLGQPTGTSIRFSQFAATAIEQWTSDRGYSCEIEKIALEGEGKIEERVELLWKLMLNWIEPIRKADFILVACHSQGVPVAIMLVAKLISFGILQGARIGVCAMAGVNLGPFADYKSRWISGSAGELFDFARPDSIVSKDYQAALDHVLRRRVKILYIGSIDDQLVSLESSTFSVIQHPYIFRAVFVDGRLHASNFLTHLVGFALKLRNLGVSDHGLIRELSSPLAGSLYSGEGHSRIYDDPAVYNLAVQYALETTNLGEIALQRQSSPTPSVQNPYILPFAMRGVLEEEYVRAELSSEIDELVKEFDAWKPSSKVLKDVKFRLEGIRSKL